MQLSRNNFFSVRLMVDLFVFYLFIIKFGEASLYFITYAAEFRKDEFR